MSRVLHCQAFHWFSLEQVGMTWAEIDSLLSEMMVNEAEMKGVARPLMRVP